MGVAEYGSLSRGGAMEARDARSSAGRPAIEDEAAAVLHVVGRVTASVQSFLGPMTHALIESGSPQIVVLLDSPESGANLSQFDHRVQLVLVAMRKNGWLHWSALFRVVREQMRSRRIAAVHFHGLKPWVIGAVLAGQRGQRSAIYLSPHGSRLMWLLRLLPPVTRLAAAAAPKRVRGYIASSMPDALQMTASGMEPVLVEGAVADVFFAASRHEARRPLVVAGNHRDVRSGVELASRIAVVLGAAELGLAFNWFGPIGKASEARLAAANVATFGSLDDDGLASRLSAGWVFIAPGGDTHFPILLAQAMATGLACIVADTPMHRAMIEHEVTGLIYRTESEAQSHLTRVVDSPSLRHSLGDAAREAATRRFSVAHFRESLLPIYRSGESSRR